MQRGEFVFDKSLLKAALVEYKKDFVRKQWPDEKYKWEAVKWFQDNWDVNAPDFADMLSRSLEKTNNLLLSANYFPAGMLQGFAKSAPEEVRAMFIDLFDESKEVYERIESFKLKAATLLEEYGNGAKQHYQYENPISTYLWLRYPDKYYIYKLSEIKAVVSKLKSNYRFKKGAYADNIRNFLKLYNEVCAELKQDKELIELLKSQLTGSCYLDPELRTLTTDVGFYISRSYNEASAEEWRPAGYSPGLSIDDWVRLLQDRDVFYPNSLEIMKRIKDYGGQATCTQLSIKYGETKNFYNTGSSSLAKRIAKKTGCPTMDSDDKDFRWWPILYVGKHAADEEDGYFIWKLRDELNEALNRIDLTGVKLYASPTPDPPRGGSDKPDGEDMNRNPITAKNIILYGPPGTGKTYSAIQYAVAIVEEKPIAELKAEDYKEVFRRYLKHKDDGLIAFTTFHQSFSYEEFIEGIRPVVSPEEKTDARSEIEYEIHDGIFKAFCDNAGKPVGGKADIDLGIGKTPTVWKVSLEAAGDNSTRTECMENNHIRIGWDEYGESISDATDFAERGGSNVLNAFYNRMQIGDIVLSCYSSKTIDAIGVVTGEPEWHSKYKHFKRLRNVNWLAKGINEDIVDINGGRTMTLSTVYKLSVSVSDAMQMLRKLKPRLFTEEVKVPNRVFIIDEINRGNISKIFGELITLIESSKRVGASEQLRARLPYSGQNFGVPVNVYIIGTMNTADRSIAMIDSALRRRFSFVEMQPDSTILEGVSVGNINIAQMLDTINKRITVLLDREHTIGHSYLLPLKNSSTIETLAEVFENSIVPLLQEYFYDDYEKIQLVLGDNRKSDDSSRFVVKKTDTVDLFGSAEIDFPEYYEVNREAFKRIEAYAFMQEDLQHN